MHQLIYVFYNLNLAPQPYDSLCLDQFRLTTAVESDTTNLFKAQQTQQHHSFSRKHVKLHVQNKSMIMFL